MEVGIVWWCADRGCGRVGWWGRLFGRAPMYRLGVVLVSSVGGFSAATD